MEKEEGSAALVGRLLQNHSVRSILRWLDGRSKQDKNAGSMNGGEPSWDEFHHLRPHFATSFTDFLLKDSQHVLESEEEPAAVPAFRQHVQSQPHVPSNRRATPQSTRGGRRCGGARSEPRDFGRARRVPLTELVVTRRPRRGCANPPVKDEPATPQKQILCRSPEREGCTQFQSAIPGSVTSRKKLDGLAVLYSYLINRHQLLGLSIEVNFLVRLLVTPGTSGDNHNSSLFMTSIHNSVYFSTSTLWHIRHQLSCLDTDNLRLLATNDRLALFRPDLAEALLALRPPQPPPPLPASAQGEEDSLMFHPELVCRENFPSDATFHAFRRQQDLFHSLLARWRGQHQDASSGEPPGDWLTEGARSLISLCPHPVNMYQLGRLFQARLLEMSEPGTTSGVTDGQMEQPAALLQQADQLRLQRLNDRFLRPTLSGRAGGRRHFPGAEDFFRRLVLGADSAAFSAALRHLLADSLLTLDAEPPPSAETADTARMISERLFRLRLLAKFLGLATFGGLHSADPVPAPILTRCIQQRSRLPPPLDLLACVRAAIHGRRLVTTLPWVVEYLCMMDAVSVLTSAHQTVFSLLVRLRRTLSHAPPGLTQHNALFLRLLYENMYEIHWHVQNLYDKDNAAAIDCASVDEVSGEFSRLYWSQRDDVDDDERDEGVDAHDVVRPSLVYVCCPALNEQRLALLRYRAGRPHQPSPALRKIIPISTQSPSAGDTVVRRTQAELREAFFQSHQPSLRRTASFVVDRISSAQIRLLRSRLLPAETRPVAAHLLPLIGARVAAGQPHHQVKAWLDCRLSELVLERHGSVVARLADVMRQRAAPLVHQAMDALLVAEQLTDGARRACHLLVVAGVSSCVNIWLNANVTRNFLHHLLAEECRAVMRQLKRTGPATIPNGYVKGQAAAVFNGGVSGEHTALANGNIAGEVIALPNGHVTGNCATTIPIENITGSSTAIPNKEATEGRLANGEPVPANSQRSIGRMKPRRLLITRLEADNPSASGDSGKLPTANGGVCSATKLKRVMSDTDQQRDENSDARYFQGAAGAPDRLENFEVRKRYGGSRVRECKENCGVEERQKISYVQEREKISDIQECPKISAIQERPKISGFQQRPKISDIQERPKISGFQQRPKISDIQERPKISDNEECQDSGNVSYVQDQDPLISDLPASDTELVSPSACLIRVKALLCDLSSGLSLSPDDVIAALEPVPRALKQWDRLLPLSTAGLRQLCAQLSAAIVSASPSLLIAPVRRALAASCQQLQLGQLNCSAADDGHGGEMSGGGVNSSRDEKWLDKEVATEKDRVPGPHPVSHRSSLERVCQLISSTK